MYEIFLNGESVEIDLIKAMWEKDSILFRYSLNKEIALNQGDELEIAVWISSNLQ
jgi:hypothetical protein